MTKRDLKREKSAKKTQKTPSNADGDTTERSRIPARIARILFIVVAVVLLIFSVVKQIGNRSKIREQSEALNDLRASIANQERRNQELEAIVNQSGDELSEYMEQIAHDRDLVYEGEKIYIVESGD